MRSWHQVRKCALFPVNAAIPCAGTRFYARACEGHRRAYNAENKGLLCLLAWFSSFFGTLRSLVKIQSPRLDMSRAAKERNRSNPIVRLVTSGVPST